MNNIIPSITIGLDLGDKKHAICVLDASGAIIDERTITNHREGLRRLSKKYPGARIALEVGSHSPWTSRFLSELGHEVLVANARKLRAIYANHRNSDQTDARMLARLGRVDPALLSPIQHGSEESQRDLLQVKLRDNLVAQRVAIIASIRFTLKSLGVTLPSPNTACFAKRCLFRQTLPVSPNAACFAKRCLFRQTLPDAVRLRTRGTARDGGALAAGA